MGSLGRHPGKQLITDAFNFSQSVFKTLLVFQDGHILEKNGFEVVSVCSKAGGIPKEEIGITGDEKLHGPESEETMCSGLIMAELLNSENTDMNILMGLGVGQDTLFYKYAKAFTVPFVIMDRVYGGATMEGVYQCFNSWGFRNYTGQITNGFELMRSAWLKRERTDK